jgi:hypothetical protein
MFSASWPQYNTSPLYALWARKHTAGVPQYDSVHTPRAIDRVCRLQRDRC